MTGRFRSIETIGFIGLGLMGRPMALNLLRAGFRLVVRSRSRPPVEALVEAGAVEGATPADVAAASDAVITMLPDTPDVEAVLEGADGVFAGVRPGTLVIDMSTIAPAAAVRLAGEAEARGAAFLDAPVSGGEIGAIDATLSIMVGGALEAFTHAGPVLGALGHPDRIVHVGAAGAGQITKVCNQMVIATTLAGVAEAFALASKRGVDPALVRRALLGGFASSRVLDVHGQRILDGNYRPGFRAELFHKDLKIAARTLGEADVPAPVVSAAAQLVAAVVASGRGGDDYSALATIVFDLAGLFSEPLGDD
ncbi:MAG: NAD-binding protein [Vicinamibacteraceae bacterium]|nr:NAD-binding protein [Vicinamibacteraceae bacterium]